MLRHYRWIVAREFLPKVVGDDVAREALARGGWREPRIPVEFSGAAYRFGHSMVRVDYGLKRLPPAPEDAPSAIPLFPDLAGNRWLRREHVIDWERFFDLGGGSLPQASLAIDTTISQPLFHLPDGDPKLPRRNLLRGRKLELPSGQEIAAAMHAPVLEEADLGLGGSRAGPAEGALALDPALVLPALRGREGRRQAARPGRRPDRRRRARRAAPRRRLEPARRRLHDGRPRARRLAA